MRIAFFADLHIYNDKVASQTDLGGPSRLIPKRLKEELNKIQPDLIFNLGDSTAFGSTKEWQNYNRWRSEVNAPIYEIFGNHDRSYNVHCLENVGEEFFTILGWDSDTKALKVGNNVFILVSEEYSPAGSKDMFTATIPNKRFDFIEKVLQKYSTENNIWVLSHTPISGTTVLSTRWMCNNPQVWWQISNKYLELYRKYKVLAHFTGHTHIDYRLKLKVKDQNGRFSEKRRGSLLNGRKYKDLSNTYFLNLPCVDIAHGWLSGRFPFLIKLDDSYKHWEKNKLRNAQLYLDSKGLELIDMIIKKRWDRNLGRSAIYYMDLIDGDKVSEIVTRDIALRNDVSKYQLKLNNEIKNIMESPEIVETDLALQYRDNLVVDHDFWFKVEGNSTGVGVFTQKFGDPVSIGKVKVIGTGIDRLESKFWYKSCDEGGGRAVDWVDDPKKLKASKIIKIKGEFKNESEEVVRIKDVRLFRVY